MIRADICHAQKLQRKCVCHISRHSSVVAVLEGIRGALIQTRVVKSVRGLPSRIISACLLAALYTPLMSYTMPRCSNSRKRERPIPSETEERNAPWCLWERSCAWKIHVLRRQTYRSHLVELYKGAPTAIREIVAQTNACDFIKLYEKSRSHFSKELLTFNA